MISFKNYEFNENQIHKYLLGTKKALTNPKLKLCSKQPPNIPQEPKETKEAPHEPHTNPIKSTQINTNNNLANTRSPCKNQKQALQNKYILDAVKGC